MGAWGWFQTIASKCKGEEKKERKKAMPTIRIFAVSIFILSPALLSRNSVSIAVLSAAPSSWAFCSINSNAVVVNSTALVLTAHGSRLTVRESKARGRLLVDVWLAADLLVCMVASCCVLVPVSLSPIPPPDFHFLH